jgi:hypothetical protein
MDMVRRLLPRTIADKDATQVNSPFAATAGVSPLRGDHGLKGDVPLRGELFSIEQLQRHARSVASSHRLVRQGRSRRLLARLADNERVLLRTYELLATATKRGRRIAPAA